MLGLLFDHIYLIVCVCTCGCFYLSHCLLQLTYLGVILYTNIQCLCTKLIPYLSYWDCIIDINIVSLVELITYFVRECLQNMTTLVYSLIISLDTRSIECSANSNIKAQYLATNGSFVFLISGTSNCRQVSVFCFCSMSSSLNSMINTAQNSS